MDKGKRCARAARLPRARLVGAGRYRTVAGNLRGQAGNLWGQGGHRRPRRPRRGRRWRRRNAGATVRGVPQPRLGRAGRHRPRAPAHAPNQPGRRDEHRRVRGQQPEHPDSSRNTSRSAGQSPPTATDTARFSRIWPRELLAPPAPQKTILRHALNLLIGAAARYRQRLGLTDPPWALIGFVQPRPPPRSTDANHLSRYPGLAHTRPAVSMPSTPCPCGRITSPCRPTANSTSAFPVTAPSAN